MFFSIKYSEKNIFANSKSFLYYNESILLQLKACNNMSISIILKFSAKYLFIKIQHLLVKQYSLLQGKQRTTHL